MNKKRITSLLLLFYSLIVFAQEPIYFNNIYNPVSTYASGRGILQVGNYYYGIFGTLEASGYWYNLGIFKMSLSGNFVNWNLIGENGFDYFAGSVGGTLIKTLDGNVAFACHIGAPGPTIGSLVKLDLNLDTIWKKYYQIEEQYTMTIKAKQTIEGGYIMVGQVYPGSGYYFDALIIKADNLGNELWYNTYGVNSNATEYGTDVIETPDGGYLIGGMKDIEAIDHSLDAMVIKTDSLGNQQWTKYYGNPNVDDDMALVAMANDGNYLVVTVYGEWIIAPEARTGRIYLIKVDTNGNTICEKFIGPHRLDLFLKNIRRINGGYILSGFSNETDTSTYQYYSGWMMKLDDNLDSVWFRDYIHIDENWENFFYDASPTSDNGYIAIGKARPDMGGNNKMWIVKVDSMGCDTPGCATGVFVEELSPSKGGKGEELYFYPNPASYKLNVRSKKLNEKGEKVIAIFNSQGLKVEEMNIPAGKETLSIDVEAWPQGIYFLILQINGQRAGSKKFIINR